MRILLFGKGGQVGWELQRSLAPLGELVALDSGSKDFCGDFTNLSGLAQTVRAVQPDVIVNAAAYTAVDKAESEPELARTINALAPNVLATEAHKLNALLVHYSTDYVFDGTGETPRGEDDPTSPLNVYGQTKLEGERLIALTDCEHLILRTSWVYAARGANFIKTMLRLGGERDALDVVADQVGAPTGAELLADVTARALSKYHGGSRGTYHVAASGETTWYDYARFIFESARRRGAVLKVQQVNPTHSDAYPSPARRPLNSRLSTDKFKQAFQLSLPSWQEGVFRVLDEILG